MADRCKNITLLQTSFAGGNKLTLNCFQEFFRNINAAIETLQHLLTWVTSQHTPKATLDSPACAAENTLYYLDRNMLSVQIKKAKKEENYDNLYPENMCNSFEKDYIPRSLLPERQGTDLLVCRGNLVPVHQVSKLYLGRKNFKEFYSL